MNDYLNKLGVCIDSKLQDFALNEGVSIIDLHILYHHQISQVENMYAIPREHYSKIMVIAFNQAKNKLYWVKDE
jgi:hypothetical protein